MNNATERWIVAMLVHLHDMSHATLDAIAELAESGVDNAKLAALAVTVKAKTKAMAEALAATPKPV